MKIRRRMAMDPTVPDPASIDRNPTLPDEDTTCRTESRPSPDTQFVAAPVETAPMAARSEKIGSSQMSDATTAVDVPVVSNTEPQTTRDHHTRGEPSGTTPQVAQSEPREPSPGSNALTVVDPDPRLPPKPHTAPDTNPSERAQLPKPAERSIRWIPKAITAVATGVTLIAIVVSLVLFIQGDDSSEAFTPSPTSTSPALEPPPVTPTTAPAALSTTTVTVVPTDEVPTESVPADPPGVSALPAGLHCSDLNAKGYSYSDAVAYWQEQGQTSDMDADGNAIPCESVYSSSDVAAYWGSSATRSPGVDFSSPLLQAYDQALQNFYTWAESRNSMPMALASLSSLTGVNWTQEMLLALATSYCNTWDSTSSEMLDHSITATGQIEWATAIAPVLGITQPQALDAIKSNIWRDFQSVCE